MQKIVGISLAALLIALLAGCGGTSLPQRPGPVQAGSRPGTITYVAVGASDAFGIGTDYPAGESWPSVLAATLGPPVHLVNLGVPGETVAQAQTGEVPIAVDAHPAIITVWLAVNDLTDGELLTYYRAHLLALLTALRQGTSARIFVGNLPDLTQLPYFADRDPVTLQAQIQAWNAVIAAVCKATGAQLVDLHAAWNALGDHPEDISTDGLHPSEIGAARLAAIFAAAIQAGG